MYNSQNITERIKLRAKQRGVSVNQLLIACELGKNTIAKMATGTDILTKNFAKIADYLECSVDYLLGRVDFPELVIKDEDGNYISKYKREYTGEEIIKLIERSKNSAKAVALGGGKITVKKELTDDDLKKVMDILNSSEEK